jgi:adenylate cyclase
VLTHLRTPGCDNPRMALGAFSWLYRRLGGWYPAAFLTVELQTAFLVTAGTLALFTFYWDVSKDEFLLIFAIAIGLTAVAVLGNLIRTYPLLRPIRAWIEGERSERATADAWAAAVNLPMGLLKRDFTLPFVIVVVPSTIAAVAILGLSWLTFFPFFFGSAVAVCYGGMLHYLALEVGMRPVLIEINEAATPKLQSGVSAFPLRVRLLGALPLINLICGLVVAALTSGGGGGADLTVDVLVALAVATTISLELSLLLSKSILRPIADLQRATEAVREGRYDVRVPVTTGDELGDLAASFNEMIDGLAERERIREAFGTYLDREVAEYILSEGFAEEGEEVDVSVLFCDVRDFTRLAAAMDAKEVVAALNGLFEVVVPIVARHGGHVDKFEGDGLLAFFGAPEDYPDHANRAVRAACAMATAVNDQHAAGEAIKIGVGVNTGRVVAGSIGGAGRLNFSVIGDPVNVASRVEAQTRRLDAAVLITERTKAALSDDFLVEDRGAHELKGVDGRVELFEPRPAPQLTTVSDAAPSPEGDGERPSIPVRVAARARRAVARATARQE